jgi:hypothetical protein
MLLKFIIETVVSRLQPHNWHMGFSKSKRLLDFFVF